jgi:phosphoserine aminotransferase
LYNEIDNNPSFVGFAAIEDRSKMNVTFNLTDASLKDKFAAICDASGISALNGHRDVGGYRASIYNALPLESVQVLVKAMQDLNK